MKRNCLDLRADFNNYYLWREILQCKGLNIYFDLSFSLLELKTHLISFNTALFVLPKTEENLK